MLKILLKAKVGSLWKIDIIENMTGAVAGRGLANGSCSIIEEHIAQKHKLTSP